MPKSTSREPMTDNEFNVLVALVNAYGAKYICAVARDIDRDNKLDHQGG